MTCRAARGFSLLDLMVIIVIVTLAALFSIAWLGSDGHQRLDATTDSLRNDLLLARDTAVSQQIVIGWQATEQNYRFVTWRLVQAVGWQWVPLSSQWLAPRSWPASLKLDAASTCAYTTMPQLIWWPNGDVQGGRLTLQYAGTQRVLEIDALGVYRVQASGNRTVVERMTSSKPHCRDY